MSTAVASVRAGYRDDTLFVATPRPPLTWKVETDLSDWVQSSAELEWESDGQAHRFTHDGRESVFVAWPFAALAPRQAGRLRVRVRGVVGDVSSWSDPIELVGGFLGDGEWQARFIGLSDSAPNQPTLLRRAFEVGDGLRRATLYATAHGVYQAELNGVEVDADVLKPGWTSYQHRLIHETTDVTHLLRPGRNVLGASMAGGWYTESYGFLGAARPFYGTVSEFAAQLVLEYADGRTQTVTTDESWRATASGPILSSGIYAGERYDARRANAGWSTPDFDDSGWLLVRAAAAVTTLPEARIGPAVRRTDEVPVREVLTSPSGRLIVDFGQNLVGRLRIAVSGSPGDTVVLRHAEVLEDGELCVRPLRYADATDHFTLAGNGVETWEPTFTFHGFRYAEIQGWPGPFDPSCVTAVVIHSDMPRTGWFDSSHPLLNRLHDNVVWGMRGNFLSLPTDCPQRDERLGWTGDIQVFSPTASYLFDCNGFLASWLRDLALEQAASGSVPFIVPDVLRSAATPAAAWGDAATVVPWVLYERFGDIGVLRAQFDSMRAWADQLIEIAGERRLWEGRFQFGDWLDPHAPPDRPGEAKTDPDIIASAYLYHSTALVARAAGTLGRPAVQRHYAEIAEQVRQAWLAEYVTPAGRIVSDTQTAYALAIMFDIATEPGLIAAMGDRLAWLVRRAGYRIGTGFVGTPLIQDALVRTGHADAARRLLLQTQCPSWLYPITMGATTVWERWDSMLEDGTVNPGEMTSFNHYAFGAIADWLHRTVAGLAPLEPGYRRSRIAPLPLAGIDHAETVHETPYGRASVRWEAAGPDIVIQAQVPPNTSALVILPGSEPVEVGSGSHSWTVPDSRPQPRNRSLSLSSSLAEIVDDSEALTAVLDAIADIDPDRARGMRRHTAWVSQRSLAAELTLAPPAIVGRVEESLAEINERRSVAARS